MVFFLCSDVLFSSCSNFKSGHSVSIILTGNTSAGVNSNSSYAFCLSLTVRVEVPAVEKHTELRMWLWTLRVWNVWGLNSEHCEWLYKSSAVTWNAYEPGHNAACRGTHSAAIYRTHVHTYTLQYDWFVCQCWIDLTKRKHISSIIRQKLVGFLDLWN